MKIKVRSTYKEGIAVTGRVFDAKGDVHFSYRQFKPPSAKAQYGECYMSPAEAQFIVESKENQACAQMGQELVYSYPAGFPVPVHDSHDGQFFPPLTDANFHVSDVRQTEAAERFNAERLAAMKKHEADAATPATAAAAPSADTPALSKADQKKQEAAARREQERLAAEAAAASIADPAEPVHQPGATTALT